MKNVINCSHNGLRSYHSHLYFSSFLNPARCQMAPAVCKKVQWAGPCCHWPIRRLRWACALILVPLVQRCRRMALSIPALRQYTHTHTHTHTHKMLNWKACTGTHTHPFYLEDEQYLPWYEFSFFLFCEWAFFNDFPCLETRAYDNISCVCLIFFFILFLYWDYRLTRLTIDILGREMVVTLTVVL